MAKVFHTFIFDEKYLYLSRNSTSSFDEQDVPWIYLRIKGNEFVFNYVQLLYYKCHDIYQNQGESYINSFDWIKNKKAAINPINKKDNKYFQYAVTVTWNHKEIKNDPQRITKNKPFINNYNWAGINFPSEKDDLKKFEKNNVTAVLNVLYAKKEKIYPAYVSKHKSNRKNQVILLMIPSREKCEAKSEDDGIILQ